MEKYQPFAMQPMAAAPMPNLAPAYTPMNVAPAYTSPVNVAPAHMAPMNVAPAAMMPKPVYSPINVHASYEEINIYQPKKHHHHFHPGVRTSIGAILVLYILLVIILRTTHRI